MPHTRVIAVASDPGGANALAPVLRALAEQGARVRGITSGPARERWQVNCPEVTAEEWDDATALSDARHYLEIEQADVLVSAAGVCNRIEHTFRLAARETPIRSVAVLDFWGRYSDRFCRTRDGVESVCWPDRICVPDAPSREHMIAEGFAPESLIVTGLPHMEQTMRMLQGMMATQRQTWRKKHGLSDDDLALVFFSDFLEPGYNVDEQGNLLLGYSQATTWDVLSRALNAANRSIGRRTHLLVKPHPLEDAHILGQAVERTTIHGVSTRLARNLDARELIVVADAIVGMVSTVLFEAALVGKPVLSVQIGLIESGRADPLISNSLGYTIPVYDTATLESTLRQVLAGQLTHAPVPRHPVHFEGATRRVVDVILGRPHGSLSSN